MLSTILIVLLIVLLLGGGYGYHSGMWGGTPGYPALGGFLVVVLIIILIAYLLGPHGGFVR